MAFPTMPASVYPADDILLPSATGMPRQHARSTHARSVIGDKPVARWSRAWRRTLAGGTSLAADKQRNAAYIFVLYVAASFACRVISYVSHKGCFAFN